MTDRRRLIRGLLIALRCWRWPRICRVRPGPSVHRRSVDHIDAKLGLFDYILPMFTAATGIDVRLSPSEPARR